MDQRKAIESLAIEMIRIEFNKEVKSMSKEQYLDFHDNVSNAIEAAAKRANVKIIWK